MESTERVDPTPGEPEPSATSDEPDGAGSGDEGPADSSTEDSAGTVQRVLKVALQDPGTLDPMRVADPGAALVVRQLFEGLTRWDPVTRKV
ncbi:MAG: hypothetical protein M3346_09605, partial [Actinomycetota bacterium]|nr:hypothetical protein [Actinomycetota bacterium]